jgi:nicotinamidase-related amidase
MTVTALDPKTALIVIDLQKGLMGLPATHPIAGVVANAATLAAAFRERGLPVVLVNVAGAPAVRTEQRRRIPALSAGWTDLIPGLNQQPQDHLVTKHTPGAFTSTGLEAHLRSLGVTQIVITGIATGSGVEMTARQAYELGLNTAFALDAMTDIDAEAHAYSVSRIFPRLGETGTTADIIALLKAEA